MNKILFIFLLLQSVYSFNFTQKIQFTNFITNKLIFFEGLSYKILKKQNNFIKYISNNNYLTNNQKKFIIKNIFYLIKKENNFSQFVTDNIYYYICKILY